MKTLVIFMLSMFMGLSMTFSQTVKGTDQSKTGVKTKPVTKVVTKGDPKVAKPVVVAEDPKFDKSAKVTSTGTASKGNTTTTKRTKFSDQSGKATVAKKSLVPVSRKK